MKFRLWALLALAILSNPALPDGKFYAPGTPPAGIPYQRALIVFDGEREVLLVQSQKPELMTTLGWVVPLPAVPEIGTLDGTLAELSFKRLADEASLRRSGLPWFLLALAVAFLGSFAWMARQDYPAYRRDGRRPALLRYVPTLYYLLPLLLLLAMFPPGSRMTHEEEQGTAQVSLLFLVGSFLGGFSLWFLNLLIPRWRESPFRQVWRRIFALAFVIMITTLLGSSFLGSFGAKKGELPKPAASVEILRHEQFGQLDIKVIAATASGNGAAVLDWLNANGFAFMPADAAAFDQHVRRGWVFTVARVLPGNAPPAAGQSTLTPPLLLRFATGKPVYPLALTATGGAHTVVDLYTLTTSPLAVAPKASPRYADSLHRITSAGELLVGAQTSGWIDRERWPERWLSHYRLHLRPEEMTDDLVLERQPEQ